MYEDIVVVGIECAGDCLVGIGVEGGAVGIGAQIIEASTVVEMVVGDEEGVEALDAVAQGLLAEVWSTVDKDVLIVVGLDEDAGTETGVVWIG